jgi:hypothetical protein
MMLARLLGILPAAVIAIHASAAPAIANGDRVALVIGNGAYTETSQLANPANDATDVAQALDRLGFDVITVVNGDYDTLRAAFRRFTTLLSDADVALFFYAGHGLQVDGRNYVVPINAKMVQEQDLPWEAFAVDFPLQLMDKSNAKVKLVVLDACRDNPLARRLARSVRATGRSTAIGQGLAPIEGAAGTLIAYATAPGGVAADGQGRNSPFTAALLRWIAEPGVEVRAMFGRVREAVYAETGQKQLPWVNESILGEFYFQPTPEPTPHPETAAAAPAPAPTVSPSEIVFWQSIHDSDDPAMFEAYLRRYPQGEFADLARLRIEALGQRQPRPTVQPMPPRSPIDLEPLESEYVTVKNANVREAPSVQSARVTVLRRGERVHVAGRVKGQNWYLVERQGQRLGYVFGALLQPPDLAAAPARPPVSPAPDAPGGRRGWLGVRIQEVTDEIAAALGLAEPRGALIASVAEGGPADRADLEQGDVIVTFAGRDIADFRTLAEIVAETAPGRDVSVTVFRAGMLRTFSVVLGVFEEPKEIGPPARQPAPRPPGRPAESARIERLGLRVSTISGELRQRFDLVGPASGLVITEVDEGGIAAQRGLKPGDVILSVSQTAVGRPVEVISRLESAAEKGRDSALLYVDRRGDKRFIALDLTGAAP